MAPKWRFISLALIFTFPLGVMFASSDVATAPNSVEVVCQLGDISTTLQDHHINRHIVLPVYMTNVSDSILGFTLYVWSNRPEQLRFGMDSVRGGVMYAKFDTVGTRSGGFEFFDAQVVDSIPSLVKISGICDNGSPPVVNPIPPGSGVLLKLIMETTEADSVCANMPVMTVAVQMDSHQSSFVNQRSERIGCNYVLDTLAVYGCCKTWSADYKVCTEFWPPEHLCLTEYMRCASIDYSRLVFINGSDEFTCGPPCQCGDANGDQIIDISDAVYLISYIFSGGQAPGSCSGFPTGLGDASGNGTVDVSDAVYLISYIFAGGGAPHCP